jgi:hypothetical protein
VTNVFVFIDAFALQGTAQRYGLREAPPPKAPGGGRGLRQRRIWRLAEAAFAKHPCGASRH